MLYFSIKMQPCQIWIYAYYSKNLYIRTLNFEGQAVVGSYLMITNSNIRLLGF